MKFYKREESNFWDFKLKGLFLGGKEKAVLSYNNGPWEMGNLEIDLNIIYLEIPEPRIMNEKFT
jgi:hypothetical protein